MEPTKYLGALHESGDGTLFVVLDSGPGHELRGRRTADGIRVETWTRAEAVDLSAESVARLHTLADARLPAVNESE